MQIQEDVDIGIVDSICQPSNEFKNFNRIEREESLIDADSRCTTSHGADVTAIISGLADDPRYHFFQIIDQYGEYDDRDLIKAIVWATDYEVDIINLSLGTDHVSDDDKDCDHTSADCAISEAAEYAANNGVTLVAAVGNAPNAEAVCCPALSTDVIAVGGCLPRCSASVDQSQQMSPVQSRPSQSYWIERGDGEGISGTFCSAKGCSPTHSCDENRIIEPWDNNPRFIADTPDTLAPMVFPRKANDGAIMGGGSSFAAPIVSATLVNIIEGFNDDNISLNPGEIRQAIRVTGNPVPDVPVGVLDAFELVNEL